MAFNVSPKRKALFLILVTLFGLIVSTINLILTNTSDRLSLILRAVAVIFFTVFLFSSVKKYRSQ